MKRIFKYDFFKLFYRTYNKKFFEFRRNLETKFFVKYSLVSQRKLIDKFFTGWQSSRFSFYMKISYQRVSKQWSLLAG